MNTSVIRYRVADFLKRHAPFDSVPEADLLTLAGHGRVKFHESDETVYRQGQAKTSFVWVVQQGRVELLREDSDQSQLLDVAGEGDLLGLDRFTGDGQYKTSARTASDVILYALEARAFEELMLRYPEVERYLAAHFSLTVTAGERSSWLDAEAPTLQFLRHRRERPAVTGPVLQAGFSTREAVRVLLEDRALAARVEDAVLTSTDLALFCGANPAQLLHDIVHAGGIEELSVLLPLAGRLVMDALARASDVDDCGRMATEFVAGATAACIRLAERDAAEHGFLPPETRYVWFTYGALARGELLRFVPPKVGIVFDDGPLGDPTATSIYGAVVAGRVSDWLHKCGLNGPESQWPEGSHPCMALSEWKYFFRSTIRNPIGHDLFSRREFFDLRALSGDESLTGEMQVWLRQQLEKSELLVPMLANDTMGNLPPLTFFSGLVVALDGTETRDLDLTKTALHPISDAARVFALAGGRSEVSTLDRLAAAGNDTVFQDAAEAYRIALYHQARAGTSRIDPSKLARLDQRLLKTAFTSVLRLLEHMTQRFLTT